jgi:TolB protein
MTVRHETRVGAGVAIAAFVTLLLACSEADAPVAPNTSENVDGASYGLVVSEPIAEQSLAVAKLDGSAAVTRAAQMVSYVSLPPGRFPTGETATITNLMSGTIHTEPLLDGGGFDPVPVAAAVGDTVEIAILSVSGAVITRMVSEVLGRVRPIVVRSDPEKGKVDVVLNVTPTVIFSEPMDGQTLTTETIQLLLGAEPVDGVVTLSGNTLRGKLTPAEPLAAETSYTLVITTGIADGFGDPLEAPVEVTFTTLRFVEPGPILFGRGGIWAINPDGSNLVQVAEGSGPAWSPDGSRIAFARDGDLYVMNSDGTGAVRLATRGGPWGSPDWSPDGSQIVFARGTTGRWDIYIINADGSGEVNLTNRGSYNGFPSWSPDGSKIAFVSDLHGNWVAGDADIYVMNTDGSNVERLTYDGSAAPAWSPDGSKIAFERWIGDNSEIFVMNADGTGAVNLTNDPVRDRWPAWAPDGSQIVFSSERRRPWPGDPSYDLWVMNADGSDVRNLTPSERYFDALADWR